MIPEGLTTCLKQTGRQIVQSVESCDSPSGCGQWVTKVANLWRTGGDVQNYWGSIMHNAHANDKMQDIAFPGHFNDADMLQVGNVGLTPEEQKSHFSLWSIMSAPLLAGTDIEHASAATLAILTAKEIVEVNQDLGIAGKLQGKFLGSVSGPDVDNIGTAKNTSAAIAVPCDGKPDQQWDFVIPSTGEVLDKPPPVDTSLHIRHRSTGKLLDVPGCKRAAEPYGPGPAIQCGTGADGESCDGKNQKWQVHANGTITTDVDGQCINAANGGAKLQTFSCARQGKETNGQFSVKSTGEIVVHEDGHCVAVGVAPNPRPSPSPAPKTGSELWAKRLSDGKRIAVLLLNLNDTAAVDLNLSFARLNLTTPGAVVRDLWAEKDMGSFVGSFMAKSVPPHGVAVLTLTPA